MCAEVNAHSQTEKQESIDIIQTAARQKHEKGKGSSFRRLPEAQLEVVSAADLAFVGIAINCPQAAGFVC
jgi:hypothetical protein